MATLNQHGWAFRFPFGTVLGCDGAQFQVSLAAAPQRLPESLSREELARLFALTKALPVIDTVPPSQS